MWLFTSDWHLAGGTGDPADDHDNAAATTRFMQKYDAYYGLLGDIFELNQAHLLDILAGYQRLISVCTSLGDRLILQPGNHDEQIYLLDSFGWRIWSRIKVLEAEGWRVLCTHGELYDRWNKEGVSVGRKITKIAALLERHISPDIDERLIKAFKKIVGTRIPEWDKKLAALARRFKCDAIIHGHDHWPHETEIDGVKVVDTGTLTRKFDDGYPFVRMEPGILAVEYF